MRGPSTAAVVAVFLWCGIPGAEQAAAQRAETFEQLEVLVKPGETIEVVDIFKSKPPTAPKVVHTAPLIGRSRKGIALSLRSCNKHGVGPTEVLSLLFAGVMPDFITAVR